MAVYRLPLSNEACNMLKSRCFLNFIIFYDSLKSESHSFMSDRGKYCLIMTVSRLPLSNEAYYMLKSQGYLHMIII